jgi:hypothetical protein
MKCLRLMWGVERKGNRDCVPGLGCHVAGFTRMGPPVHIWSKMRLRGCLITQGSPAMDVHPGPGRQSPLPHSACHMLVPKGQEPGLDLLSLGLWQVTVLIVFCSPVTSAPSHAETGAEAPSLMWFCGADQSQASALPSLIHVLCSPHPQ